MKLLIENWRKYLTEAAATIENLPDDVKIKIDKTSENYYSIKYVDSAGNDIWEEDTDGNNIPYGTITITKHSDSGACGDAWHVYGSGAKKGWGPLLYDLAIELATLNGGGLIADRRDISPDAKKVWNYYSTNRNDVKAHQLDDLNNTLTPPNDDNCNQNVAGKDFKNSPLSKRYTKPPTTINQLNKLGKIIQ